MFGLEIKKGMIMLYRFLTFSSLLLCGVVFCGCSTGYSNFYTSIMSREEVDELKDLGKIGDVKYVKVITPSDSAFDNEIALLKERCYFIGYSSFNGPYENPQSAREKARSVGANTVLAQIIYTDTVNGSYTYMQQTQQTTNYYGNFNANWNGGYGFGNLTGSSTTYGSVPVTQNFSVRRYDHFAGYFYCD